MGFTMIHKKNRSEIRVSSKSCWDVLAAWSGLPGHPGHPSPNRNMFRGRSLHHPNSPGKLAIPGAAIDSIDT